MKVDKNNFKGFTSMKRKGNLYTVNEKLPQNLKKIDNCLLESSFKEKMSSN